MADNVIPFPGQKPEEPGVIPLKLTKPAADALARRVKVERVSPVDALNRAIQFYDTLTQNMGKLSLSDELLFEMETLPGKTFIIYRRK